MKRLITLLACFVFVALSAQGNTVTNNLTKLTPASAVQELLIEQLGDMVTSINALHTAHAVGVDKLPAMTTGQMLFGDTTDSNANVATLSGGGTVGATGVLTLDPDFAVVGGAAGTNAASGSVAVTLNGTNYVINLLAPNS